ELWEWQSQEYCMQKDSLAAPCSSLWAEASNNVGGDWSIFEEQTPIKHCTDFEFQFCDVGDIIVKEFEERKETLQAKRTRMLQFCPENLEMTCSVTEDGLLESLQEMIFQVYLPSLLLEFWCTDCLLNSDGTDELPEEWLVNIATYGVENLLSRNNPAAATEETADLLIDEHHAYFLVHQSSSPVVVHDNPACSRPTSLK
ncbi:hypothetical protein ACJX0J_035660, partial [Zea mays]